MSDAAPLLSVRDLRVHYAMRGTDRAMVKAVDGLSFDVAAGRTVALVGESGCGKSTTAYAILGLEPLTSGSVRFEGRDITQLDRVERRRLADDIQIVLQDPSAALDPKMRVSDSIAEPLAIRGQRGAASRRRVAELLDLVGLTTAQGQRTPDALSGGQRQRVVIARALALAPKLVILDEPVSALDVSIRSQVLNLLMQLQRDLGLAYLFISHDLSVVSHIADETIVMVLGTAVERGATAALFEHPLHPYTQALLSAIPLADPIAQRNRATIILSGDPPSPLASMPGCAFASRCPIREDRCATLRPSLNATITGTATACLVRAPDDVS